MDAPVSTFVTSSSSAARPRWHTTSASARCAHQLGSAVQYHHGTDNGDTFFNERPSFGTPGAPGVITTQFGSFNVNPSPGQQPIPINFGHGPANTTVNLRLSKTFGIGAETSKSGAQSEAQSGTPGEPQERGRGGRGGHGGGPGGGGFGGPRGMGGILAPSNTTRRFNLTLTVVARNIFNFWNPGTPIGILPGTQAELPSSNFGKSVSLAGGPFSSGTANRRVDFQALFSF